MSCSEWASTEQIISAANTPSTTVSTRSRWPLMIQNVTLTDAKDFSIIILLLKTGPIGGSYVLKLNFLSNRWKSKCLKDKKHELLWKAKEDTPNKRRWWHDRQSMDSWKRSHVLRKDEHRTTNPDNATWQWAWSSGRITHKRSSHN